MDPPSQRSFRVDLAAQLLLAVLALVPFYRALFLGDCVLSFDSRLHPPFVAAATPDLATRPANFVTSDLNGWIVPEAIATIEALRAGEAPLWNPYALCGQPLLANLALPAFYPPNWLLLGLEPLRAFSWIVALHLALAGIFAFRFLRGHGLAASAALFGGAAVEFAPFLAARVHLPSILATAAWTFAILRGIDRILEQPNRRAIGCLGLGVGGAALAGFPQLLVLELAGAALYTVLRLAEANRARRIASAGAAVLGVGLGIGIGAIHLAPAVELLTDSLRGRPRDPSAMVDRGLEPANFLAFVLPDFFGHPVARAGIPSAIEDYLPQRSLLGAGAQQNPVENTLWPGGGVLIILLAAGHRLLRARAARALLAVALLGLVLATDSPLLEWIHRQVPLVGSAGPKRALVLFTLTLPALAAFALDALILRGDSIRILRRAAIAVGIGSLALAGSLTVFPGMIAPSGDVLPAELTAFTRYTLERTLWLLPVPLAFIASRRIGTCVAILELMLAAHAFNPTQSLAGQYPRTPAIEFLASAGGRSVRFADHTLAAASFGGMFGYPCFDGMEPMVLSRFGELVEAIEPGRFDPADPRVMRAFQRPASLVHPAFLRAACPNVVANRLLDGLELVYRGDAEQLAVFRQALALPRARLVPEFEIAADREARLARLADPTLDPRRCVVLERDPGLGRSGPPVDEGVIARVAAARAALEPESTGAHSKVAIRIEGLADAALLVLADSFDDDWTVAVDGAPAELLVADHAFRAVVVPAGAQRVVFEYRPRAFQFGMLGSVLGLFLAGALILLPRLTPTPPPESLAVAS